MNFYKMRPEVYFLKYAYPCSWVIQMRGEILEEDLKRLEDAAVYSKVLPREYLERIYFRAFARIKKIAAEMGKNEYWDNAVIEEYFRRRHNAFVDASEHPESLKKLCRVHEAEVLMVEGNKLVVRYKHEGERQRKVRKDFVPDAKAGEKVTIHYHYAIERV